MGPFALGTPTWASWPTDMLVENASIDRCGTGKGNSTIKE